jgi:hypothetical protein
MTDDLTHIPREEKLSDEARAEIWEKIEVRSPGSCWFWLGALTAKGYGQAGRGHAHRIAYRQVRGEIPDRKVLDHMCRSRNCANPRHLRLVTRGDNTLFNSLSVPATNRLKTHCKRGHELSGSNVTLRKRYEFGTERRCRACGKLHDQMAYARKKRRLNNSAINPGE